LLNADFSARYDPSICVKDEDGSASIAPSNYPGSDVIGCTLQTQGVGGTMGVLRSDLVQNIRAQSFNSLAFGQMNPNLPIEEQLVEDHNYNCQTLYECFLKQLHYGLIMGTVTSTLMSGAYDYDVQPSGDWLGQVILDLTFWLVITIFMMNIVLGVIVDTFSALRAEQNEQESLLKNTCFICATHRAKFDQLAAKSGDPSKNFETHIRKNHNIWNYVKFIAYLRHKVCVCVWV